MNIKNNNNQIQVIIYLIILATCFVVAYFYFAKIFVLLKDREIFRDNLIHSIKVKKIKILQEQQILCSQKYEKERNKAEGYIKAFENSRMTGRMVSQFNKKFNYYNNKMNECSNHYNNLIAKIKDN